MIMRKALFASGLLGLLAAALSVPSAATPVQVAIGQVLSGDGSNLGQVGFRVWSLYTGAPVPPAGPTCDLNGNFLAGTICAGGSGFVKNTRCLIAYNGTNTRLDGGGYIDYQESTGVYNGDPAGQQICALADAEVGAGTPKHIAYWGVSCRVSSPADRGDARQDNCLGLSIQTCLDRLDNSEAHRAGLNSLKNTFPSYPVAPETHTIASIGGLDPNPAVRVRKGAGCGNGTSDVCLLWDDPSDYRDSMNGSTSPVRGTNLYRRILPGACNPVAAPGGSNLLQDWSLIHSSSGVDTGAGAVSSFVDTAAGSAGCAYYATTVRVQGPRQDCNPPANPSELETGNQTGGARTDRFVGENSQGVNLASGPTAVRIVRFNATYRGRGVVSVSWQSGLEGDVSGFYVTRGTIADGAFLPVSGLVRARGDDSDYSVADKVSSSGGRVYYYQLQIVLKDGSVTTSWPVSVALPVRVKRSGPSIDTGPVPMDGSR